MSSTQETIGNKIRAVAAAANADDLGERPMVVAVTETGSGWDAYEVWHRFIKEARDRREAARNLIGPK